MPQKEKIESMFDKIAPRYDLLNNILSVGTHWLWKRKLVKEIKKTNPQSILDIATGTGDIIGQFNNTAIELMGTDISVEMLREAKIKFPDISFLVDDITESGLLDKRYDVSCISYGIRNVSSIEKALDEMQRVTNKNILILEFGQPENFFLKGIYFGLMKYLIPFIGSLFGSKDSYQYLIESSMNFPSGQKFKQLCKEQLKCKSVEVIPIFGGITYLYNIKL
jgi:demethylmenaquinone methyltransferase/2-methoxy-6-polyprenyl-1,4-benzoquinol methylase